MNKKNLEALIKGLNKLLDDLEDNKAPRTGFSVATEEEEKEFIKSLNIPEKRKQSRELIKVLTKSTLAQPNCLKHKSTPLTRVRSKARICSKCEIK